MGIVLNEYDLAEDTISSRSLGRRPVEALSRVAKYYYANGYRKQEIRKKLATLLLQSDPSASLCSWSGTLDRLAAGAGRYKLIRVEKVTVTCGELERIGELGGTQLRRLAFTLLCLSKYWDAANPRNNHWVNSPDKEIMAMANIKTSVRRQSELFAALMEAGLIRFSRKVDNLNVCVLFSEDGKGELEVVEFRNLGYQYSMHMGGAFFVCENCGLTVPADSQTKGRRRKYCRDCAALVKVRQNVDSMARYRAADR